MDTWQLRRSSGPGEGDHADQYIPAAYRSQQWQSSQAVSTVAATAMTESSMATPRGPTNGLRETFSHGNATNQSTQGAYAQLSPPERVIKRMEDTMDLLQSYRNHIQQRRAWGTQSQVCAVRVCMARTMK